MRVQVQADGALTVSYGLTDCDEFNRGWPCSSVKGRGSWVFDKDGNLVDATGSASKGAGEEWVAFSRDCQTWGRRRAIPGSTIRDADWAVQAQRRGICPACGDGACSTKGILQSEWDELAASIARSN